MVRIYGDAIYSDVLFGSMILAGCPGSDPHSRRIFRRAKVGHSTARMSKKGSGNVQAKDQLRPARKDGRQNAGGNGALPARRHAAAGKLRDPRACDRVFLVFRRFLAQHLSHRRARSRDQGIMPPLCVSTSPRHGFPAARYRNSGQHRRESKIPSSDGACDCVALEQWPGCDVGY